MFYSQVAIVFFKKVYYSVLYCITPNPEPSRGPKLHVTQNPASSPKCLSSDAGGAFKVWGHLREPKRQTLMGSRKGLGFRS